jgi:hypothetical protein
MAWPSAPTARPWPRGTAGGVGGVVLWDTARRVRLQEKPLAVTEGSVNEVAFSPDGKTLAAGYGGSGGRGGGVVQFDIDLTSWCRQAGSIANRNLSRAEWQEYFPGQAYRKTFDWLPAAPGTEATADVETPIAPATPSTRKGRTHGPEDIPHPHPHP